MGAWGRCKATLAVRADRAHAVQTSLDLSYIQTLLRSLALQHALTFILRHA